MLGQDRRLRMPAHAGVLLFALVTSACAQPTEPQGGRLPLGERCTVQFRRDALGAGASAPISPVTHSINGADVAISGELIRADADWLVVRNEGKERWIARRAVLLVEFAASK